MSSPLDRNAFSITFGAMAAPLRKQLSAYRLPPKRITKWQREADAITLLSISGVLRDPEKTRARNRIVQTIISAIRDRE